MGKQRRNKKGIITLAGAFKVRLNWNSSSCKCVLLVCCVCVFSCEGEKAAGIVVRSGCLSRGSAVAAFEVAHPAEWVGCVPLDMASYTDLSKPLRLMGHQREERGYRRERGGLWEIRRKLGWTQIGQKEIGAVRDLFTSPQATIIHKWFLPYALVL